MCSPRWPTGQASSASRQALAHWHSTGIEWSAAQGLGHKSATALHPTAGSVETVRKSAKVTVGAPWRNGPGSPLTESH